MRYHGKVYKMADYYFQALSLDKDRYLATNNMLNILILAASAFIVTISTIVSIIPNNMEFKTLLKNHILLILKDNDSNKYIIFFNIDYIHL